MITNKYTFVDIVDSTLNKSHYLFDKYKDSAKWYLVNGGTSYMLDL